MSPKVSVIVPVYNVEDYLKNCLDSLVQQTLSPIEVICVDDGSTDASSEILAEYAAKHPEFRVFHQKNSGVSVARNLALDEARGEYISFLDSDDRLLSADTLEKLYNRVKALDADELFFDAQISYASEEMREAFVMPDDFYRCKGNYPNVLDGQTMYQKMAANRDIKATIWQRIYRRAFLEENRLRFYPGIIHQDEVFSMECTSLVKRMAYYPDCCYDRHYRPNSTMTTKNLQHSVYSSILAARALRHFAKDRLSKASPEFMRLYKDRIDMFTNRAADRYLALTHSERAAFLRGLSPSDGRVIRPRLCAALAKKRLKGIKRRISKI